MMSRNLVRSLSLYVIDQLQDMEAPISTIRLVKLLYLIDLEYYSRHSKTLTGIDWIRYYFGPYFVELPQIIESLGVGLEKKEIQTEHGRGFTFRTLEEQSLRGVVDSSTETLINRVIKQWANEDTPQLLEHVYGTLPVKHSKLNEPLDFTYETDALYMQAVRDLAGDDDFVTLDDLLREFGDGA